MSPKKNRNVVPLLSAKRLRAILENLDSSNIFFTKHAEEKLIERKIDPIQAIRVLRRCGRFEEEPWFNHTRGSFNFTVLGNTAGADLKVVAAIELKDPESDSETWIITVHYDGE